MTALIGIDRSTSRRFLCSPTTLQPSICTITTLEKGRNWIAVPAGAAHLSTAEGNMQPLAIPTDRQPCMLK
jgi:hypothetical protein